jgi:hypothetical protein
MPTCLPLLRQDKRGGPIRKGGLKTSTHSILNSGLNGPVKRTIFVFPPLVTLEVGVIFQKKKRELRVQR